MFTALRSIFLSVSLLSATMATDSPRTLNILGNVFNLEGMTLDSSSENLGKCIQKTLPNLKQIGDMQGKTLRELFIESFEVFGNPSNPLETLMLRADKDELIAIQAALLLEFLKKDFSPTALQREELKIIKGILNTTVLPPRLRELAEPKGQSTASYTSISKGALEGILLIYQSLTVLYLMLVEQEIA